MKTIIISAALVLILIVLSAGYCDTRSSKMKIIAHRGNSSVYPENTLEAYRSAIELGADEVEFVMDSELVIKQMNGEYKVKSPNIIELHRDAKALSSQIPKVRFTHVRRSNEFVSRADALLNHQMDVSSGSRS